MKVRSVMSYDLIVVAPEEPLAQVHNMMVREQIRHVPVVSGTKLVGILSRGDVLLQAVPDGRKAWLPDVRVGDAMTRSLRTCTEDSEVSDVAEMMIAEKIECMPVVTNGELVGVVTSIDLIACLTHRPVARVASFARRPGQTGRSNRTLALYKLKRIGKHE